MVAVHPFGEEMNKSRRMVSLGARAMAAKGYAVLAIDLHGCGDSSGDLVQASWHDWIDDVLLARDWLAMRYPAPLWLWGTRAGCLVAAEAARREQLNCNFILWQPQVTGRQVLQQFLRLKMASQMQQGAAKGLTDSLQRDLVAGQTVEVAGYRLGPEVALGLGGATLLPPPTVSRALWLEVSTREPARLLPASEQVLQAWREAGVTVQTHVVSGPQFWQTLEIEDAPELVRITTALLDDQPAALA